MKIVVCVKQVPDSAAKVVVEGGKVTWGDAPLVINPWDEFAVEAALVQKEALDGEVIALSLGPEGAKDALKHALAMGCTDAILISDPALAGSDSQAISSRAGRGGPKNRRRGSGFLWTAGDRQRYGGDSRPNGAGFELAFADPGFDRPES